MREAEQRHHKDWAVKKLHHACIQLRMVTVREEIMSANQHQGKGLLDPAKMALNTPFTGNGTSFLNEKAVKVKKDARKHLQQRQRNKIMTSMERAR